jgi:hypothetical protein
MISRKTLTVRNHRRAFAGWSSENGLDLSSKSSRDAAVTAYAQAHGLDNDIVAALDVTPAEAPRVITMANLD